MPTIIHIETATEVCSAALSSAGEVLLLKENLNAIVARHLTGRLCGR